MTGALRVMGLTRERHFTHDHRVLNRATWSARHGSRMLLGWLITLLVPPGAALVCGADDTVERRSGRKIRAKGCYRDAVRSTKKHVSGVDGSGPCRFSPRCAGRRSRPHGDGTRPVWIGCGR